MEARPLVLIIEDDADVLKAAALALGQVAKVEMSSSPEAVDIPVQEGSYGAILLDMNFALGERSGRSGIDALTAFKAADPAVSVVLMTTYGGVALAVEGLKRGASDFILKPWRNEALVAAVARAAALTAAARKAEVKSLDEVEAAAIRRALERSAGNVSGAAAALGLTRQALYRRMARHGL